MNRLQAYSEVRFQPQQQFESEGVGLPLFIVTLAKVHGASSSPSPHLRRYTHNSPRGIVTVNVKPWQRARFTSIRPLWDSAIHEQTARAESYGAGLPCDPAGPFGSLSLATRVMEISRVSASPLTPSFTMVPASPRIILITCS
mgnify:CR=1 FL=1